MRLLTGVTTPMAWNFYVALRTQGLGQETSGQERRSGLGAVGHRERGSERHCLLTKGEAKKANQDNSSSLPFSSPKATRASRYSKRSQGQLQNTLFPPK